jgi:hypothetical protein
MPTSVFEAPNMQPCIQVPLVTRQENERGRVTAESTSIMGSTSILYAAPGSRHAGAG